MTPSKLAQLDAEWMVIKLGQPTPRPFPLCYPNRFPRTHTVKDSSTEPVSDPELDTRALTEEMVFHTPSNSSAMVTKQTSAAKHIKEYLVTRRRERKQSLVASKGGHCQDCGYEGHQDAFHFDHVRGQKIVNISVLLQNAPWLAIVSEAEKCDLVCATCHAIRTANRRVKRE